MRLKSRTSHCKKRARRSCRAQGLAELAAALVIIVPLVLLVIDCVVITIGAAINDQVCRDAARAAASGPPGSLITGINRTVPAGSPPYSRALAVVQHIWVSNIPAKVRDALILTETVSDVPPAEIGGPIEGDVSVETTVDVYPPFLLRTLVGSAGIAFHSRHDVTYTYIVVRTES